MAHRQCKSSLPVPCMPNHRREGHMPRNRVILTCPSLVFSLHVEQYRRTLLRGLAVLCSLTAELLSMLVAVLPLEEAQKASKAKHAGKHGTAPSPAHAAAAAAAARAAGTESSLSKEMLRLGE